MRYHYEKPDSFTYSHGRTYYCNHPIYDQCTLYLSPEGNHGLAVIQQRFDKSTKSTWWTRIDNWLVDDIFERPKFADYFNEKAGEATDGLYPTVTVRQIMWALKMKPLPKQPWETVFDHTPI